MDENFLTHVFSSVTSLRCMDDSMVDDDKKCFSSRLISGEGKCSYTSDFSAITINL